MNMNKRFIWIIELFLWAIVAIAISFLFVFIHSVNEQQKNSYYLFFNDIDGLTKGSPVRLMGMQIGYVQDIKVFGEKVFVSFLVTDKKACLPEPATATVEFYGLGGSKSLEVMPIVSNGKGKEDFIITKEPYRIQMFYNAQNDIARTLVSISNSFTSVINEKDIKQTQRQLIMSDKVKLLNGKTCDANEKATKYLDKKNIKQEDSYASAKSCKEKR